MTRRADDGEREGGGADTPRRMNPYHRRRRRLRLLGRLSLWHTYYLAKVFPPHQMTARHLRARCKQSAAERVGEENAVAHTSHSCAQYNLFKYFPSRVSK